MRSRWLAKDTVNEVVAELDGSDFEDSEDDVDGYLDMESDAYTNERRDGAVEGDGKKTQKEDFLIGTNVEIGSNCSTEQSTGIPPKYTLHPGGSAAVNVI